MNTIELQQMIKEADMCGDVLLIESLHGIGKSTICDSYAKNNDMHYEPLILSLMDVGDMLGMPQNTVIGGLNSTNWAAPDWYSRVVNAAWPLSLDTDKLHFEDNSFKQAVLESYPKKITRDDLNKELCHFYGLLNDELQLLQQSKVWSEQSKRSVILIDEMNRSAPDILNAGLQFINDKRLHSHKLPIINGQHTLLIAAINPADKDYTVSEFDPALLDRFVYAPLDPSPEQWLDWARENKVNDLVRGFVADNPNKLHFMPKDGKKGSSNRSMTRIAKYMDKINNNLTEVSPHYIFGVLGTAVGSDFLQYVNQNKNLLTVEKVEEIVNKKPVPKEFSKIVKRLEKPLKSVEAIKRMDLVKNLEQKYINTDADEATPYLACLHALPLETVTAYIKTLSQENDNNYKLLAELDKDKTEKALFFKILQV